MACITLALALAACGDEANDGAERCADDAVRACRVDQNACRVEGGAAACFPCGAGEYADATGACVALAGDPLTHVFPDHTVQPGEEVLGQCQSWTLGNETDLWVNAVELVQNAASHHSNWTFVPEDVFDGPDGLWACKDRDYDQLSAALEGGVLYAQSTQAPREVQKFPDGAAVRVPARSRIISDVHLLNTTSSPITGHAQLTIYPIAEDAVTVRLAPFHMTYEALAIPPHATSRFTGECDLQNAFEAALDGPIDMRVFYALPHTHALGSRFFLEVMGGPLDGTSLLDVRGFNGEARGQAYDPPVDLAGMTGLRFGCEFENPRSETVGWGFGDQEMCEMLGFAEMGLAFESRVSEANPAATEDGMPGFTGPCSTLAFRWDK